MILRHKMGLAARTILDTLDFIEVETPYLLNQLLKEREILLFPAE